MTGRQLEAVLARRSGADPLLRDVVTVAERSEASPFLVGGYVRDAALGRRTDDLDLLCVKRTSRLVGGLQERWSTRGFRFRRRGVTTWRFTTGGRQVDLVDASRRGLLSDLRRREATLNAISFDLLERRLHDPLRGLADLRAGRFRAPRPGVIHEDPVRALRAARFTAELPDLRLSRGLEAEARRAARALGRAPAERIREELNRLLAGRAPHRGLRVMDRLDLIPAVLPELEPLRHAPSGLGRPDAWTHTLDTIEISAVGKRLPAASCLKEPAARRVLRWALLLHDLSKPETRGAAPDGRPTFHGHEVLGAQRADRLLRRLRAARDDRKRIRALVRLHLRPGHLADAGAPPRGMRRLVREAGDDLPLLVLHAACDARGSGAPDAARRWKKLRAVLLGLLEIDARHRREPPPRLVDGRDVLRVLGLTPGPDVGRILARVRDAQESGALRTRDEALDFLARLRSDS